MVFGWQILRQGQWLPQVGQTGRVLGLEGHYQMRTKGWLTS